MPIYSIWESRFPAGAATEGRDVTQAIWRDMPGFEGYVGHEVLVDVDDPGHILVVSRWTTRERADAVLQDYAGHPNARTANRLVTEPRRRFLATRNDSTATRNDSTATRNDSTATRNDGTATRNDAESR